MALLNFDSTNYSLEVSGGNTYIDLFMAYGGDAYFQSLSVSGTAPSLKNVGYAQLWNGLRTLDISTGIVKKVLYFGETPLAPNDVADKDNWSEIDETQRFVVVQAMSIVGQDIAVAVNGLVATAANFGLANFNPTRDHGKIFFVGYQGTFSQNGFYIARYVSGDQVKLIRALEYGSEASVITFKSTLIYNSSDYHIYRFPQSGTTSDKYEKDDYINNGVLSRSGTAITLTGTLDVTGNTLFRSAFQVNGISTLGTTNTGALSATTLNASGAATLSSTLAVTGNASVGGTLGVTGVSTLSAALGVTGDITTSTCFVSSLNTANNAIQVNTNKFTVKGSTGNTTIAGTLAVTGATALSSLGVSGIATIGSTLNVTGATTLSSTLDVSGVTALASTLTVSGNATFSKYTKSNNYVIDASGNATYNLSLANGNVQYINLNGAVTSVVIALLQDASGLSTYLGGTFLFIVINNTTGTVNVAFTDDRFIGITSATTYSLTTRGAGIAYTGLVTGDGSSTSTNYLYGTLSPAYSNLMT